MREFTEKCPVAPDFTVKWHVTRGSAAFVASTEWLNGRSEAIFQGFVRFDWCANFGHADGCLAHICSEEQMEQFAKFFGWFYGRGRELLIEEGSWME